MKTYIQDGDQITVTTPSGGSTSGVGMLIGTALWGVAKNTSLQGEQTVLVRRGVVTIAKTSALAISAGDRLYWDNTNKVVNKTASAQLEVGVALEAAANPSPTVVMSIGQSGPIA